jgi:hypothetical protein
MNAAKKPALPDVRLPTREQTIAQAMTLSRAGSESRPGTSDSADRRTPLPRYTHGLPPGVYSLSCLTTCLRRWV